MYRGSRGGLGGCWGLEVDGCGLCVLVKAGSGHLASISLRSGGALWRDSSGGAREAREACLRSAWGGEKRALPEARAPGGGKGGLVGLLSPVGLSGLGEPDVRWGVLCSSSLMPLCMFVPKWFSSQNRGGGC